MGTNETYLAGEGGQAGGGKLRFVEGVAREGVRDYGLLARSGSRSRLKRLKQERVSARPLGRDPRN